MDNDCKESLSVNHWAFNPSKKENIATADVALNFSSPKFVNFWWSSALRRPLFLATNIDTLSPAKHSVILYQFT